MNKFIILVPLGLFSSCSEKPVQELPAYHNPDSSMTAYCDFKPPPKKEKRHHDQ